MRTNTTDQACGACQAAPGTEHSAYCDDPMIFMAAEAMKQADDQRVARARYELATALAQTQQAIARVEAAREALTDAMEMARLTPDAMAGESMAAAKMAGVRLVQEEGWSEVKAAKAVGIDRMTLRKALGKR